MFGFSAGSANRLRAWDLFVLVLSVYILAALAADLLLPLPVEVSLLIQRIDFAICVLLLADFFRNLLRAPNKVQFMKWGWIDLVSSIPAIDALRWGRLARVIRLIRMLRVLRASMVVHRLFVQRRNETAAVGIVSLFLVTVFSGSLTILLVETSPSSSIQTAEDAIWWAIVTVTTWSAPQIPLHPQ